MTDKKDQLPPWKKPTGVSTGIKVFNTFTLEKNEFVTHIPNLIKLYICGPTVYDLSHLGHARAYIGTDIVRRIFEDYFQIPVTFVENITDVDDKIIKAANSQLVKNLMKFLPSGESVDEKIKSTATIFIKAMELDDVSVEKKNRFSLMEFVQVGRYLKDFLLYLKGKKVASSKNYTEEEIEKMEPDSVHVARENEKLFWEDMDSLDVRPPTVLTRVTEYIPEIVEFIKKIIENGFAYEKHGSVYFDIQEYRKKFVYGKLEPWSVGDLKVATEGEDEWNVKKGKAEEEDEGEVEEEKGEAEGKEEEKTNFENFQEKMEQMFKELDVTKKNVLLPLITSVIEKKTPFDFALWKKSNPGEPQWPSPWGLGRPGWHIECSVMSTHILGSPFDIHMGGNDLAFPHHENEIAQTVAFQNKDDWVRYFMHLGRLDIEGLKMSKSLKNFTIIRDALKMFKSSEIRMLFLMREFHESMDYSLETMNDAKKKVEMFYNFFQNIKTNLREKSSYALEKWDKDEMDLFNFLQEVKQKSDEALRDNLSTKKVINLLLKLRSRTYKYLEKRQNDYRAPLLFQIVSYISHMFKIFGLIMPNVIGLAEAGGEGGMEEKFIDCIAKFRDKVRVMSKKAKNFDLLKSCDELRDQILPNLGVMLEDQPDNVAVWKQDSVENIKMIIRRREEEIQAKREEKRKQKQQAQQARKKKGGQQQKRKKLGNDVDPKVMFVNNEEYKGFQFDENGIPTHDEKGKQLSKKRRKRFEKMWAGQSKKFERFQNQNKK